MWPHQYTTLEDITPAVDNNMNKTSRFEIKLTEKNIEQKTVTILFNFK